MSQAKGRVSKYEERLQELAATPGVPKVEVGSLEEVRLCQRCIVGESALYHRPLSIVCPETSVALFSQPGDFPR